MQNRDDLACRRIDGVHFLAVEAEIKKVSPSIWPHSRRVPLRWACADDLAAVNIGGDGVGKTRPRNEQAITVFAGKHIVDVLVMTFADNILNKPKRDTTVPRGF